MSRWRYSTSGTATAIRAALAAQGRFPVLGRVSMDLIAIGVDAQPELREGDWVRVDFDLPTVSQQSGRSQYELLTGLGHRFARVWG